jgi:hypothetical protein
MLGFQVRIIKLGKSLKKYICDSRKSVKQELAYGLLFYTFYWNTIVLISLPGCACTIIVTMTVLPAKTKIFTVWPSQEKHRDW